MTPFILWLNKNEVDELISLIIKSNNEINYKDGIFSPDELIQLTETLIEQNDYLISILKKIKPFLNNEQINAQLAKNSKETSALLKAIENINSLRKKN